MSENFVDYQMDYQMVVIRHPDGSRSVMWVRAGEGREEVAPLTEERILQLTRKNLTLEELDRTPSCSICLEDFQAGQEVLLSGCPSSHPGLDIFTSQSLYRLRFD